MMQFKQAALVQQQIVRRIYQSGGGNTSNLGGVLSHVATAGFLGMVGQYMIDGARGKSAASPLSAEMLTRASLNGMGAGVLGDALIYALQQPTASKQQALMASDALGPAVGTLTKGATALLKTVQGVGQGLQGKDSTGQYGGKEWASLLHSLTPGQNIFYTKAAFDYTLINQMHQIMGNGGYLETLRQQTAKTPGWPEALGGPGGSQQIGYGGRNFWE